MPRTFGLLNSRDCDVVHIFRRYELLVVCVLIVASQMMVACAPGEPSTVVVAGESFTQDIVAWTDQGDSARVRIDQPVRLFASRSSGPWVTVERATLPADACWLTRPPPEPEPSVADNLRWIADPPGAATYNLGIRPDHSRDVRFSKPGTYRLTGSSRWCGEDFESNQLTITVVSE